MTSRIARCTGLIVTSLLTSPLAAQSGIDDLIDRLGAGNVPTGAGVVVGQVEALEGGDYAPDQGHAEFAGKTFVEQSGPTGVSLHATSVGLRFYGTGLSIAPDVDTIHLYDANTWVGSDYLWFGGGGTPPAPIPTGLRILNHSWVGLATGPTFTEIHRRADFAVTRDDVVMINGMGDTQAFTENLMHHMYNGINVGKTDGTHQTGPTSDGRVKPEIVSQQNATSFATAKVSSVMAVLVETARGNIAGNPDAERSQVLKAVLMAGGHHNSSWTNDATASGPGRGRTSQPLDDVLGAGEADVNRSHLVLTGGEQNGVDGVPGSLTATHRGWDLTTVGIGGSKYWRFCVRETAAKVSILATWHRDVASNFASDAVADFDLTLWRVDGGGLTTLVGNPGLPYFTFGNVVSESAVDNVEHLFLKNLAPGEYVIELARQDAVAGATGTVALAWLMPAPIGDCSPSGGDGTVDVTDLLLLLAEWGTPGPCDMASGGDGTTDVVDLLALLAAWGAGCG